MATLSSKTGTPQYTTIGTNLINYISNPSDAANWGVSSTGTGTIAVSSTTTSTDLPLGPTVTTAIKILSTTAGTKYVYTRFTMPAIQTTTKHTLEWFQRQGSGFQSGEWQTDVYYNASSDYSGAYTRVPLSTDASAVTQLPAADGKFATTFDGPLSTALYYEVRFSRPTDLSPVSAATLNIAQALVGPGSRPQGAVVTDWKTDLTFVLQGASGTPTTPKYAYMRVGSTMFVKMSMILPTTTASIFAINIPTGYTLNTAVLNTLTNGQTVGYWNRMATASDGVWLSAKGGVVFHDGSSTTQVFLALQGASNQFTKTNASSLASAGELVSFSFELPIAEWAGSGTINVAQNDVEYASNSSTSTTASDTTSFAYGPQGNQIQNITAALSRRVRFQTPIQATDQLVFQVSDDRINWISVPAVDVAATGVANVWTYQNGTTYGLGRLSRVSGAPTDLTVDFGQYAWNTSTYGAGGTSWSSSSWGAGYWRVVKARSGQAVGFGSATNDSLGLVLASSGTYSPTLTIVGSSLDALVLELPAYYQRIGNTVMVYGRIYADAKSGTSTFTISLPIARASNFTGSNQAAGIGIDTGTLTPLSHWMINANSGSATTVNCVTRNPADVAAVDLAFHFMYSLV